MKNFSYLFCLFCAISGAHAGGWKQQLEINGEFTSVHFANNRLGAVTGTEGGQSEGVIYRTSDAGLTWQKAFHSGTVRFTSIRFSDELHAWAMGIKHHPAAGINSPYLLYSEDAGISWVEKNVSIPVGASPHYSLTAVNNEVLYLTDHKNHIVRTTDAGLTWNTVLSDPDFHNIDNIVFADPETGWARVIPEINADYYFILHTQDGGQTWNRSDSLNYSVPGRLPDFFLDPQYGWDLRDHGPDSFQVYRTSDGGLSWDHVFADSSNRGYGSLIQFPSVQNGWIAGPTFTASYVYHTTDGGATWAEDREARKLCATQHGIWFPSDTSGWIVGKGKIMSDGTIADDNKGIIIHYSESYSAPVSAEEQPQSGGLVQILPAENSVLLRSDADGIFSLEIYDIMGNLRLAEDLSLSPGQLLPLNTSGLTDGVYFVSLQSDDRIVRGKFTIVR